MGDRDWKIRAQQLHHPLGSLVEVGEVRHSTGGMARYRYLRRYAIVVVTRGQGHYEDETGRQTSLPTGSWILVFPDLGHCYGPDVPGGWDEVYAIFEGSVFDTWRQQGVLDPSRPVGTLADPDGWVAGLYQTLCEEDGGPLTRLCAFQSLLARALDGGDTGAAVESAPGRGWFTDACRLLSRPDMDASRAAAELGMNYETFRRKFRAVAGISPHRYHRQEIVNIASRMLDTTGMKCAEIASALGFSDEAYFSRVFKQIAGRSPRDYRARKDG